MSLDLLSPLRDAVLAVPAVVAELAQWKGEPCVFTRRPVPSDAADPMVVINPPASIAEQGGLTSDNPVVTHDVIIYGAKSAPGSSSDQTRAVERAIFALRDALHRQRFSVQVPGFHVIDVRVAGPMAAPVDDDGTVARMVTVTVRLNRRLS